MESQEYRTQSRRTNSSPDNTKHRPRTVNSQEHRPRTANSQEHRQPREGDMRRPRMDEDDQAYQERRRKRMEQRSMMRERRRKRRRIRFIVLTLIVLLFVGGIGAIVMLFLSENPAEEGYLLFQEGDYKGAIVEFEKAVEERENLADAYLGIALSNWELGQYDGLESMFNLAYANGAEMTGSSRNMLASLQLAEGDYQEALTFIQQGLSLPGNSDELIQEFMRNEIVCYEELGDWETAKAKLAEYTARYPDDAEAAKDAQFLETR